MALAEAIWEKMIIWNQMQPVMTVNLPYLESRDIVMDRFHLGE